MIRRILTAAVLLILSTVLYIYANPYSVHQFIYAGYVAFDTVPSDDGIVRIDSREIDFRTPRLTLSRESVHQIQSAISRSKNDADWDVAVRVANFVRSKLNARNDRLPAANQGSAEAILRNGLQTYCLCSEHARLFAEAAQAVSLQCRVIWLEGHVVAEYYDNPLHKWVFLDPHLGVTAVGADQQRLSVSEMIHRLERGQPLDFTAFPQDREGSTHARTYDEVIKDDPDWYRNVLLNGEAYAYSGRTLIHPGRWSHLFRYGRFPQILVLRTSYDSSPGKFVESFSTRKLAISFLMTCLAFWALRWLHRSAGQRTREPVTRSAASSTAGESK